MNIAKPLFYAVALASLSLPACGGAAGEEEGSIGEATQAEHGSHGGACKPILVANGLPTGILVANGLTTGILVANGLTSGALATDADARTLLSYVVSCALRPDQSVQVSADGVTYTYTGAAGLAPEWGEPDGSCGNDCQQWVSACVLSRVDYLGQDVTINLRGENEALESCNPNAADYTVREATYYGNIFASTPQRYACLPPGQTEIPRVCGPTVDGCVVDVLGSCEDLCGHVRPDGSYPDCRAPDADDKNSHWHFDHDDTYEGSITVFLKP